LLPALGVGGRECRVASFTAKAMEGVKSLDCSSEELPGVEGVERSDGGDGNWGDPPRPDGLRCWCCRSMASYNRATLGKWAASREGVGGGRITA
jgi:hypothetical protein